MTVHKSLGNSAVNEYKEEEEISLWFTTCLRLSVQQSRDTSASFWELRNTSKDKFKELKWTVDLPPLFYLVDAKIITNTSIYRHILYHQKSMWQSVWMQV